MERNYPLHRAGGGERDPRFTLEMVRAVAAVMVAHDYPGFTEADIGELMLQLHDFLYPPSDADILGAVAEERVRAYVDEGLL